MDIGAGRCRLRLMWNIVKNRGQVFGRLDPQPEQHASECDDCGIVAQRLLVAGRESSGLLQQVEGAFDFGARLVQLAIIFRGMNPRRGRGQNCHAGESCELGTERDGAVRLIANQAARLRFANQIRRRDDVVALPFGDAE